MPTAANKIRESLDANVLERKPPVAEGLAWGQPKMAPASPPTAHFINIRSVTRLAKKQKYLSEDPAEDIKMPQTKSVEKPVMLREQILSLLGAITDLHDCVFSISVSSAGLDPARSSDSSGRHGMAIPCCRSGLPTRATSTLVGRRRNRAKHPSQSPIRFALSSRPGRQSARTPLRRP